MKTNLVRARGGNSGKDILSKGSEVGGCLACSRNTQEVGAAVTQGVREHETWSESGSPRLAHIEPYDNSGFFLGIVGRLTAGIGAGVVKSVSFGLRGLGKLPNTSKEQKGRKHRGSSLVDSGWGEPWTDSQQL